MSSAVSDALAEVQAALKDIEPKYEGLQDFNRLNLTPEAKTDVQKAITEYAQRVEILQRAEAALLALEQDDYPALPTFEVSSYDDLKYNRDTVDVALGVFRPATPPAAALDVTVGAPVPK